MKEWLQNALDSFLLGDLISICFSYCEIKEYLVREVPKKGDIMVTGVAFCHNIYTFVNYFQGCNSEIRSFSPEGTLLGEWNTWKNGKNFRGISGNPSRNEIYAIESIYNCLEVFSIEGKCLRKWSLGGYEFMGRDICVSQENEIFVGDGNIIKVFDLTGKLLRKWGQGRFFWQRIAVSPENEVYIGDFKERLIHIFSPEGKFLRDWKLIGQGNPFGNLNFAISPRHEVYVTSADEDYFQIYTLDGRFLREWHQTGDNNSIRKSSGIAISPNNEICAIDCDYIRMFDLRM